MIDEKRTIIFFDGVCHLCNGFVDWVIQKDKAQIFFFAPLQGSTAQKLLPLERRDRLEAVVCWQQGQLLVASDAVLYCFLQLPWPYRALAIFEVIPKGIRDALYFWIARHRYAWWGQRDSCRLPTAKEKGRLLS